MEFKRCFKCGKVKPLSEFYKHKQMADGYLNKCKECAKKDSKNNHKNFSSFIDSYDKTEKGVIRVIYKAQKFNSKRREMPSPSYTKKELRNWLYQNDFKKIYDKWIENNFEKDLKPSIDRINDFKPYTFDNIRLVTWKDNREKEYRDILHGIGTAGKKCKPVLCFDENTNLIAEYVSYSSAVRAVGYFFERVLHSHRPDRKNGFIWWYKEDYSNNAINKKGA